MTRFLCLFGCVLLGLSAQTFRGNIAGVVRDSSGAAIAGAAVKLDSSATGLSRATLSADSGDFSFAELPVGKYTLLVSHPGFETRKIDDLEVAVSKITNLSVSLGVAQQQSVVEVSAQSVTLETSS